MKELSSIPLKKAIMPNFYNNFGIAFLVPYNKDIGRITRF